MQGPKWPLFLLVHGPGVVVVNYRDMFYTFVQRRLCPIFMSGIGLPDIHEYSAG